MDLSEKKINKIRLKNINKKEKKMKIAEMVILRKMYGMIRLDRIRKKYIIKGNLGALDISGKIRENRLRLF